MSSIRHRSKRYLLLAGMLLMAALVTQCKMVTDAAVRPQVDPARAGDCVSACAHAANEALKVESELHKQNVKACGDAACKQQEAARHEAAVKAIQAQRKACQSGCHHQGGGRGGR